MKPEVTRTITDAGGRRCQPVRRSFEIHGRVQGIGFRPFVFREAVRRELRGSVRNTAAGVRIELEGPAEGIDSLLGAIRAHPLAVVRTVIEAEHAPDPFDDFRILPSESAGGADPHVTPDLALCPACRRELFDPADRRFGYALISCAQCGPRYGIMRSLPYDRVRTTMSDFDLCASCVEEYSDPRDRRFHAEPLACCSCGPTVSYCDEPTDGDDPVARAANGIRAGMLIGIKGIGGYHLAADAGSASAVQKLRGMKRRPEKAFAVMFPDIASIGRAAHVSPCEREALESAAAPVVLLDARSESAGGPASAGSRLIGAMLPYSPLHALLMEKVGAPVVLTSANRDGQPMRISDEEARGMFDGICDGVLLHDRRIARRVDDSVVRRIAGGMTPFRIGRGLAPVSLPAIPLPPVRNFPENPGDVLALGANEKAGIALARRGTIHLSQHLGDLDSAAARQAFREAVADFVGLHGAKPALVVHDLHPDYFTTNLARELAERWGCRTLGVQHHRAHFNSLLAEEGSGCSPSAVGVCWDGTGYGTDGTVWGGEMLRETPGGGFERIGSILPMALPGGDRCASEPWRVAEALLFASGLDDAYRAPFADRAGVTPHAATLAGVRRILSNGTAAASASSMGRLFDGVASLIGLRHVTSFSGQAAMELEYAAMDEEPAPPFTLPLIQRGGLALLDWRPMIREIAEENRCGIDPGRIAARFHETLAQGAVAMLRHCGASEALLTGGCFQNRILAERVAGLAEQQGIRTRLHRSVPPNDGGIAAGQAYLGMRASASGR